MTWDALVEVATEPGDNPAAWEDVSARLTDSPLTHVYGRTDELGQDEVGVLRGMVLDNEDGKWDQGIEPNTGIRVDINTEPFFRGVIESAPARWYGGVDNLVHVQAVDRLARLARETVEVDLDEQLTGARIVDLLDIAGWSATARDVDPGRVRIDAIASDPFNFGVDVLNEIREAVRTEQGMIYQDGDGTFVFRDRHSRLDAPVAATFGPDDAWFTDVQPQYDDLRLWTVGRAEMSDRTVIKFIDDAAVDSYGRRVMKVMDLPTRQVENEAMVMWGVMRYSTPRRRYPSLVVDAELSATSKAAVVGLRPNDLVRIQHVPLNGTAVDDLVHVERITDVVTHGRRRVTCETSPYFGEGPWLAFDDVDAGFDEGMFAP